MQIAVLSRTVMRVLCAAQSLKGLQVNAVLLKTVIKERIVKRV